jgi:hypothetical protein
MIITEKNGEITIEMFYGYNRYVHTFKPIDSQTKGDFLDIQKYTFIYNKSQDSIELTFTIGDTSFYFTLPCDRDYRYPLYEQISEMRKQITELKQYLEEIKTMLD